MRINTVACVCLIWLLCLLTLPATAQIPPSVTITPGTGEVANALLLVEADGLQAHTRYRIEIRYADELLLASDEETDAAGHIPYPITSTAGDLAGVYQVIVLLDGEIVARGQFTLTEPVAGGGDAQITVAPPRAAFGSPQTVRIADLRPRAPYTIEIIADQTAQLAYRRAHSSSAQGDIEFEIFAQPGDAAGAHTIAVYDAAGDLAALGGMIIEPPITRNVALELIPAAVNAGEAVQALISGLAAFDAVSAHLTSTQGILIEAQSARASSEGAAGLVFRIPAGLSDGAYVISVFVDGQQVADANLQVGADMPVAAPQPTASAPQPTVASLTVSPDSAPLGSSHRVIASGLPANDQIAIEISFGGAAVFSTVQRADANGVANLDIITGDEDQPGAYRITLQRDDGSQTTADFVVTASETVSITPAAPPEPVAARVQVIESRLQAGAAQLDIQGEAGQLVEIRALADGFDPAADLIGRDGATLLSSDDSRGGKHAILGPLTLPYSGTYQVAVTGAPLMMAQAAQTGAFRVEVETVRAANLSLDGETPFTLTPDAPRRYYGLSLAAGDHLSISVDSGGDLDSLLQLVAPDGAEVAFDDDSGAGLDAELSNLAIEASGDYILVLSRFDGGGGSGVIRARRNPVRLLDAAGVTVALNDKSASQRFVFDAAVDELLILNLRKLRGDVADLFVRATVDGMEVMSHSTMGVPDELPLAFVMPMSGRVLLNLEKIGFDDGITLDVSLERPRQ